VGNKHRNTKCKEVWASKMELTPHVTSNAKFGKKKIYIYIISNKIYSPKVVAESGKGSHTNNKKNFQLGVKVI
jgi:hypothetical protein